MLTRWVHECENSSDEQQEEIFEAEYEEVGGTRVTARLLDGQPRTFLEKLLAKFENFNGSRPRSLVVE